MKIRFVGGPKDGAVVDYPDGAPRVLVFQGKFSDGTTRVVDYERMTYGIYRFVEPE